MNKKITIIGLGYVGLPLALLAEKKGYMVAGLVSNSVHAEKLNNKKMLFKDVLLEKKLKQAKNIRVSSQYKDVRSSSMFIICVPTPITSTNKPDLSILKSVAKTLGKNLGKGQTVILESTVNPGVSEEIVIPLLEQYSKLVCGRDFYYAHCPERINPGDTKWNVLNIPRVIGGYNSKSAVLAKEFYSSILESKIIIVDSLKEAESVKIVENAFRDINIAFVNELAISFDRLGIDVVKVIQAAATKPFSFMSHFPGAGVGGHCIPVDPYYLIEYAGKKGFNHEFLKLARKINNSMPAFTVSLLEEGILAKNIKSPKVLVLGLAYKKNIGDTRESPGLKIVKLLRSKKINVKTFDPYVLDKSDFKNINEALRFANTMVLVTDHDDFGLITPKLLKKYSIEVVVDGRNSLEKKELLASGIYYKGIGR